MENKLIAMENKLIAKQQNIVEHNSSIGRPNKTFSSCNWHLCDVLIEQNKKALLLIQM